MEDEGCNGTLRKVQKDYIALVLSLLGDLVVMDDASVEARYQISFF